jgi:hypothetical protein
MRFTWLVVPAVLSLAGFAACSSSTATTDGPGTGADASTSVPPGTPGKDSGAVLPGADAGTDSSAAVDSAAPAACTAPSGCMATEVCCGTIPITGGTVPNCTTGGVSTVCAAPSACATKLGTSCSGTQTVRLCTKNADCAESADGSCCTFGDADGGSLSFCANALVGAFGGGKCQ